MSLGLKGVLIFKNLDTEERARAPAYAAFRTRQIDPSRASQRLAIHAHFPHLGLTGSWTQARQETSEAQAAAASRWIPISFRLSDPKVAATLEAEIGAALARNPEESAKNSAPNQRARRVRLDEWARGWLYDLCYEPLQGLGQSAKLIQQLHQAGKIDLLPEQELAPWLAEQVALGPSAWAQIAPGPEAQTAPAPLAAPAPPRISAPEPISSVDPLPTALAQAATPLATAPETLDFDAAAQSVFTSPEMPSFSALAAKAAQSFNGQRPAPTAQPAPAPQSQAPAPAAAPTLDFQCVRLPVRAGDKLNWSEALFLPQNFVPSDLFGVIKGHWRANLEREGQKKVSLYSMDALTALAQMGVALRVEGQAPLERHFLGPQKMLDPERLALHAFDQSPWEEAKRVSQHALSIALERQVERLVREGAPSTLPLPPAEAIDIISARPGATLIARLEPKLGLAELASEPGARSLDAAAAQKLNALGESLQAIGRLPALSPEQAQANDGPLVRETARGRIKPREQYFSRPARPAPSTQPGAPTAPAGSAMNQTAPAPRQSARPSR